MTHILVVILHDLSRLPALLNAWRQIGVPGVTLINTMGGYQAEGWLAKLGLGGLSRLLEQDDIRQRTLFSVISDEELLEKAISEADTVVEGFDRPHSGILFTLPVDHTLGIRKRGHPVAPHLKVTAGAPGGRVGKDVKVSQIVDILKLDPIIVPNTATLPEVVEAMMAQPSVHMVCVVNNEQRLIGVIDLAMLAEGFFFTVFPEKFISELKNLDQALNFASQTHIHLAVDLMKEPVWIKMSDNLETAFERMHERRLPGLPVIDDNHHITGYINMLELMRAYLREHHHEGGEET